MSERDPLDDLPWPKPPEPGAAVSAKICGSCTRNLASQKCRSARRRAALSMLFPTAAIGVGCWFALDEGFADGIIRSGLYGAIAWSAVLSVTLLFGLASPPGQRPRVAVRVGIAVLVPLVFLVYLTNSAWGHVSIATFSHGAYAHHALRCGAVCFAAGALMSGGVMLLWRRTDPLTPGLSGALLGLVGGMGSALGMGVACPSHEAWHLIVSHGVVVISLVVLGAAAGRRLLAP